MDGPVSSFMFLCIVTEALGYTPDEILDSNYVFILSLLREHSFMMNKRNRELYGDEAAGGEGDYIETVDFATGKTKRVKKAKTV